MSNLKLVFILLFVALFGNEVLAAISAKRFLSSDKANCGMLLEVTIELSVPETRPTALILSEILPDGLRFESATWRGKILPPSLIKEQSLKWFFGLGGEAVSPGLLIYRLRVVGEAAQKVFFSGSVQSPNAQIEVHGERILWLNHKEIAAPEFMPPGGGVFEQELQISLKADLPAGADIFLCLDEPESWEDWQLYEGPFVIQHSQRLQAQIWLGDDSASLTGRAEYYRQDSCELELRQGWNLIGIPLELAAQEYAKLNTCQLFTANNRQAQAAACGQTLWLFAENNCKLCLSGREPFQRHIAFDYAAGWSPACPVGLEEIVPSSTEVFWAWEGSCYQLATELKPGKGYWRYQSP